MLGVGPIIVLGTRLPKAWVFSAAVSAVAVAAGVSVSVSYPSGHLDAGRDGHAATRRWRPGSTSHRVSGVAFGISLALAGVAGVFAPFMLGSITPDIGVAINITAFAVIVVGTLGNPLGTVLGGIIYGVSLMLMQTYFSSWANLLPNLLLIAVLLVRPEGLFGRQVRRA